MSRRSPFAVPAAVVSALAMLVAGFCGFLAALVYFGRIDHRLCVLLGIVLVGGSGLAAGIFWSRMLRWSTERKGERGMVSAGAGYGVLMGLASTAVLHAGLAAGSLNPVGLQFLPIGIIFALAVGASLGAIGGFWFRWAARDAAREAPPAAREEAP